MKIVTILGTRPEIIRLSCIIERLDGRCQHVLVHTGQNFDPKLNSVFFEQLGVREPDYSLEAVGTFGEQVGTILKECERILLEEQPDGVLVLGDTNSALSVVVAKRLGITVFHMEAGNRCYDDRVPEEVNRRLIDHASDVLMPYTERSRSNLLREGIEGWRVYVIGNPIYQVIESFRNRIEGATILSDLGLEKHGYFLVTMHRTENVDVEVRLRSLTDALMVLYDQHRIPIIVSTHPRTRQRMEEFAIKVEEDGIRFLPPFGLFEFVSLEWGAQCVLTDSGTVQEECCIYHIPSVTIRDVTERPETVECGSNILSGVEPEHVVRAVDVALHTNGRWVPPREYLNPDVAATVVKVVLGYQCPRIR